MARRRPGGAARRSAVSLASRLLLHGALRAFRCVCMRVSWSDRLVVRAALATSGVPSHPMSHPCSAELQHGLGSQPAQPPLPQSTLSHKPHTGPQRTARTHHAAPVCPPNTRPQLDKFCSVFFFVLSLSTLSYWQPRNADKSQYGSTKYESTFRRKTNTHAYICHPFARACATRAALVQSWNTCAVCRRLARAPVRYARDVPTLALQQYMV